MSQLIDEVVFRVLGDGRFTIEASYNYEFVEYLKGRVPSRARSYDFDLEKWTVRDDDGKTLNALEGVAAQKFRFAQRVFYNADGKLVTRNIKTGKETIQKSLFTGDNTK